MAKRLRSSRLLALAAIVLAINIVQSQSSQAADSTPLDRTQKPAAMGTEEINKIYSDMVVVQRKAREKKNLFLFNTFMTFDFSDGPTTLYSLNFDVGYALTERLEIYANFAPVFIANERQVVSQVGSLVLADGKKATVTYSKPRFQYGVELLWAPAYGKDSWGPNSIIRSDTFFKLSFASIQFENDQGIRSALMLGKTFFLSRFFNLRLAAGLSTTEVPVNNSKQAYAAGNFESGAVWYL